MLCTEAREADLAHSLTHFEGCAEPPLGIGFQSAGVHYLGFAIPTAL